MPVFDAIAMKYDSWYETPVGSFADQVETGLAFRLFTVAPGMKVLDAGCGTGNFSLKLDAMGAKVTGMDISEEMLEIARRKAAQKGKEITLCKMDLYKLDFPDETFDAVFSMAAFEFVEEPEKALDEMFRVVKKGGKVLVGTIHGDSDWGRLYMSDEVRSNSVFQYACFKTLEEMQSWKPDQLLASGQCLFVPPGAPDEDFCMEKEAEYSKVKRGGFICAVWSK